MLTTRLAALRPLNEADRKLRQLFDDGGLDARLLYTRYGPDVLLNCLFAKPSDADAGRTYLLYALPSILTPHFLHLFALGTATSGFLSGREGSSWRTVATISGLVLAVAEIYFLANYDDGHNIRSTRLGEIDFVHWKLRVWRGLAITTLDALLGWAMWLQATGRAFVSPVPAGARVAEQITVLEGLLGKTRGLGVVKNGSVRDAAMRRKVGDYWIKEGEVMKDVFEQPEVLEAQRSALRRVDITRVGREAEAYVDSVLGGVRAVP